MHHSRPYGSGLNSQRYHRRACGIGFDTKDRVLLAQLLTESRYEGYIKRQEKNMKQVEKRSQITIPDGFDYQSVSGLSNELTQKLEAIKPVTLAQASQIQGMTPAALSLLSIMIKAHQADHAS